MPPTPVTQSSKRNKDARLEINRKLSEITQKLNREKKSGNGVVAYISEGDDNYNKQTDFTDKRHLSPQATTRFLSTLNNLLPEGQKLISPVLKGKLTARPYRGCYGTYPLGCRTCTAIGHNESACPLTSKKRNRSHGDEQNEAIKNSKI